MSDTLREIVQSPLFAWRPCMVCDSFGGTILIARLPETEASWRGVAVCDGVAEALVRPRALADHPANVGPLLEMLRAALGDDADDLAIQFTGGKWWIQCWPARESMEEHNPIEEAHWSLVVALCHAILAAASRRRPPSPGT